MRPGPSGGSRRRVRALAVTPGVVALHQGGFGEGTEAVLARVIERQLALAPGGATRPDPP